MRTKTFALFVFGIVFFAQSLDAQTWGAAKRLTWNSGSSNKPAIATDTGRNIHVVWHDYLPREIFYKQSTDYGKNWSPSTRLTWNSGDSYDPDIAIDSKDNVHVVWHDYTHGKTEIYYKRSFDGGKTWEKSRRLTYNPLQSSYPEISVDSLDNLHVVWFDFSPGNNEIFYKKSTDGGETWTTRRLTWNGEPSYYPDIAIDADDNIHLVWHEEKAGAAEIMYKKSADRGKTWSGAKRLTWNAVDSRFPDIASDITGAVHIVWFDYAPGNADIFHKSSTDAGATWKTKRLTWNPSGSYYPNITTDSNNQVLLVWEDFTPGNYEIFFMLGKQ